MVHQCTEFAAEQIAIAFEKTTPPSILEEITGGELLRLLLCLDSEQRAHVFGGGAR